jgi:putative phosphoribosyl transferase
MASNGLDDRSGASQEWAADAAGPLFDDRVDAGRQLAQRLRHLRSEDVVVVGLPRGGLPVALQAAIELQAPLDVIVVRKLGVPFQPELAMGAIGEDDVRVISTDMVRLAGISQGQLTRVENRERQELQRRSRLIREHRARVPLAGRVVVVVDDGVATGTTAYAACQVARAQGAARVVVAVPVAPVGWRRRLASVADELICVATPEPFDGIGRFYADFTQTSDEEVLACLAQAERMLPTQPRPGDAADPPHRADRGAAARDEEVRLRLDDVDLGGRLTIPAQADGVVVFAHGSGSSRFSPRNRLVGRILNEAGLATLLFDLLTDDEAADRANVFDINLLAGRLLAATRWLRGRPGFARQRVGLFGASTGAAAALWAAAEPGAEVTAVVSRGGRPDLAGARLAAVTAPTLLIVGGLDTEVLGLNRQALRRLHCEARLEVIPGATHLFEQPGTLQAAANIARVWFVSHLSSLPDPQTHQE